MVKKRKSISLAFVFLLCFSLVAAVGLDNPNLPIVKPDPTTFDNTTGSVNNSLHFDGYSVTTLWTHYSNIHTLNSD